MATTTCMTLMNKVGCQLEIQLMNHELVCRLRAACQYCPGGHLPCGNDWLAISVLELRDIWLALQTQVTFSYYRNNNGKHTSVCTSCVSCSCQPLL